MEFSKWLKHEKIKKLKIIVRDQWWLFIESSHIYCEPVIHFTIADLIAKFKWLFCAALTLLVGCCLWTGFFVAGNLQDVQKEINSKKFPFGYSYVIAWVSWFLSVISFALIYCYRRGEP